MDIKINLNPGSAEAVARGCTCPRGANAYGKGPPEKGARFIVKADCPLHARQRPGEEIVGDRGPVRRLSDADMVATEQPLLEVLVEMECLTLPQRAVVLGHMIGHFTGAAVQVKHISHGEALKWVLGEIKRQIDNVKRH